MSEPLRGREDSREVRIRVETERQQLREEWTHEVWKKLVVIAGVTASCTALVGAISFAKGRASADDLTATNTRQTRLEQVVADHIADEEDRDRHGERKLDRMDQKMDEMRKDMAHMFEQLVVTARRVGARELPPARRAATNTGE